LFTPLVLDEHLELGEFVPGWLSRGWPPPARVAQVAKKGILGVKACLTTDHLLIRSTFALKRSTQGGALLRIAALVVIPAEPDVVIRYQPLIVMLGAANDPFMAAIKAANEAQGIVEPTTGYVRAAVSDISTQRAVGLRREAVLAV